MHNIFFSGLAYAYMDTPDSVTEHYYNNTGLTTAAVHLVHTLSICD